MAPAGLLLVLVVGIVVPTSGLCLPAAQNPMIERASQKIVDTASTTLVFTGGAGVIAVVLATVIALAASENSRARLTALAQCLLLWRHLDDQPQRVSVRFPGKR